MRQRIEEYLGEVTFYLVAAFSATWIGIDLSNGSILAAGIQTLFVAIGLLGAAWARKERRRRRALREARQAVQEDLQQRVDEGGMIGHVPIPAGVHIINVAFDVALPKPPKTKRVNGAKRRALRILLRNLTPEQRASFQTNGVFEVKGSDGATYSVSNKGGYNVSRVSQEWLFGRLWFCAYPQGNMPSTDRLLAQKLLLETDAPRFCAIACKSIDGLHHHHS